MSHDQSERLRQHQGPKFPDCGVCDRIPGVGHVATVFLVYSIFLLGPGETVFVFDGGGRYPLDRSYRSIVYAYVRYYGTFFAVVLGAATYWWSQNDYPHQFLLLTGGIAAALGGAVLWTWVRRNAWGERRRELCQLLGVSPDV